MEVKERIIKFGFQVRDLDRDYEKCNNQDFDTGIYHKFAYKEENEGKNIENNLAEEKKDETLAAVKQTL